jgi:hypothetical protein
MSLIKRLKTFRKLEGGKLMPLVFTRKSIAETSFKSKDWDFDRKEREVILDFKIPVSIGMRQSCNQERLITLHV